ncbi:MAG: dihydrofolate reductase [Eubacteriales bacterium]
MKAIVLVDQNWGIGNEGKQNVFITEDLKRFKEFTTGNTIILGRKTLDTFPSKKPLPNRRNIILSRNPEYTISGAEVFSSVEETLAALSPNEMVYVVGGASIYQAFLPYCTEALVTKVEGNYPADCYFPSLDDKEDWTLRDKSNRKEDLSIFYRYCLYQKKKD